MRRIVFARMFLILWLVLSFTRLTYAVTEAGASLELPKDIVLLLDNSGSMKKTDPQFLVKKAVEQFVRESPDDTWLGVLVFDRDARLAFPLTSLAAETRDSVVAGLAQLDYRGLLTNIPAAMERAIYELKLNGREDATKSIVFLTDGIVDTGNRFRDFESVRWLREELAGDAARNGIRIYQVALSDEADFQLLQSLAQRTRGEYFRAYRAEDTARVLQRIKKAIIRIATPTPEAEVTPELPESRPGDHVRSLEPTVSQPQASVTPSVTRPPMQSRLRDPMTLWLLGISAIVILLTVGAIWALVWSRRATRGLGTILRTPALGARIPRAFLYDLSGVTGRDRYELSGKLTLVGRIPPNPEEHVNHMLIELSTIGRRHAVIEWRNHAFWLIDQKSRNGTFVNGQRVSDEVRLKHGDRIRFFDVEFEFAMPGMDLADETVVIDPGFGAPQTLLTGPTLAAGNTVTAATRSPGSRGRSHKPSATLEAKPISKVANLIRTRRDPRSVPEHGLSPEEPGDLEVEPLPVRSAEEADGGDADLGAVKDRAHGDAGRDESKYETKTVLNPDATMPSERAIKEALKDYFKQ